MKVVKIVTIIFIAALVFLAPTSLYGRVFFQGEFVDIPSSRVLPHLAVQGDMAMHAYMSEGWNHTKGSQNISIGLLDWAQANITFESEQNIHANFAIIAYHETRYIPSITLGIQNITQKTDISQFGSDFSDHADDHNQNFSIFAAFAKNWDTLPGLPFITQIGIGSGRFTGSQGVSKNFHGIFAGLAIWPSSRVCLTAEEDGRDLNAGMLIQLTELLTLRFAVTDIEKAFDPNANSHSKNPGHHAKLAFGISYRFNQLRPELSRKEQLIDTIREERNNNRVLHDELENLRKRRETVEEDLEILKDYLNKPEPEADDKEDEKGGDVDG